MAEPETSGSGLPQSSGGSSSSNPGVAGGKMSPRPVSNGSSSKSDDNEEGSNGRRNGREGEDERDSSTQRSLQNGSKHHERSKRATGAGRPLAFGGVEGINQHQLRLLSAARDCPLSRTKRPLATGGKKLKRNQWWCNLSSSESSSGSSPGPRNQKSRSCCSSHPLNADRDDKRSDRDCDLISGPSDNDNGNQNDNTGTERDPRAASECIGMEILTTNQDSIPRLETLTNSYNEKPLHHPREKGPIESTPNRQLLKRPPAHSLSPTESKKRTPEVPGLEKQAIESTPNRHLLKPPPAHSSLCLAESQKKIVEIHERIKSEVQIARQYTLEEEVRRALEQKAALTSRNPRSRSRFSHFPKEVELQCKQGNKSQDDNYHTVIVNSSLTVLQTSDDTKLKADVEQLGKRSKAINLSLMPYELKILEEQFGSILDELPPQYRFDADIHNYISDTLDTPPEGMDTKVEAPSRYKGVPEAASDPIGTNENDADYVSVMKGFRDFCPQCKTFDCQFHITSYPDAATQASVAIQYDKRAISQLSRSARRSFNQQPVRGGRSGSDSRVESSVRGKARNSFTVDVTDGQKFHLSGEVMECPFCRFPCRGSEKLSKHLKRYHSDSFYFETSDRKITARKRTVGTTTMIPKRQYYHPNSKIPIQIGHHDRDLDDESLYSWYHDYRKERIEDFDDLTENEKKIESLWNRFLGCSSVVVEDRAVPKICMSLIRKHSADLSGLEWEFYQLVITLWERRMLSVIDVEQCMLLYHSLQDSKLWQRNATPLNPRKRVICSRLHLIFQSLGGGMPRFLKAISRTAITSQDLVNTPVLDTAIKWPKLKKKRKITEVVRMRAQDISRPFFFPCFHAGPCTKENGCTCIENDNLCTKHCIWGEYGINFYSGCHCTSDCRIAKLCPCRDTNRECDPDTCMCCCTNQGCDRKCANMDVTLANRVPLLIGRSSIKGAGLGLFTKNPLKKGDYIDEYIGEFIKREHEVNRSQEYYFDHSDDYVIDATYQGNKTRFLNHSQTPNIEAKHRFVNGEKRIAFYAKQDIPSQSELFYSYGKSYNKIWRSKGIPELCVDSDDDGFESEDDESESLEESQSVDDFCSV